MKRKHVDEDISEEYISDTETTSEEETVDDNEIDLMVDELSKSIPRQRALNLLHSMAASKEILYWNSHGEMTYHQRRIPVTSINELMEYSLLPYNPDVRAPRGLKTFTNGLIELGINKNLIGNQKLLVDLVARQPEDDNSDDSSGDDESQSSDDQSDDHEENEEQEERNNIDDEDESNSEDEEEHIDCHVCQEAREFSKISILQCPSCYWHEGYYNNLNGVAECDICTTVFPANIENTKKILYCCTDCNSIHQLSLKSNRLKLVVPKHSKEEIEEADVEHSITS